ELSMTVVRNKVIVVPEGYGFEELGWISSKMRHSIEKHVPCKDDRRLGVASNSMQDAMRIVTKFGDWDDNDPAGGGLFLLGLNIAVSYCFVQLFDSESYDHLNPQHGAAMPTALHIMTIIF
ncbi:hypothetical protein Tco_1357686, partial [Tanacetum coccineum]